MKSKHSVTSVFIGEIICWDLLYNTPGKKYVWVWGEWWVGRESESGIDEPRRAKGGSLCYFSLVLCIKFLFCSIHCLFIKNEIVFLGEDNICTITEAEWPFEITVLVFYLKKFYVLAKGKEIGWLKKILY